MLRLIPTTTLAALDASQPPDPTEAVAAELAAGLAAPRGRGRPFYVPSPEAKEIVSILRANGNDIRVIAKVLRISTHTLEKHFADELKNGLDTISAKVGTALVKAALNENVGAMKTWLIMRAGWRIPKWATEDAADEIGNGVVRFYLPANGRDQPEADVPELPPPPPPPPGEPAPIVTIEGDVTDISGRVEAVEPAPIPLRNRAEKPDPVLARWVKM